MNGFCHLNLHTDRSQFVGMIKPREVVSWCKQYGLGAAAVTDHDNICAAVELYKHCKAQGIKPIYGMEVSICSDKTKRERGTNNLVLLAKTHEGFKNLIILATISGMYFYYRPRIDMADVREYSEGLIALTACLNGLTAHKFFTGGQDGLRAEFLNLRTIFGDDLYLEVQPTAKEAQRVYNHACVMLANDPGVCAKLVATGDPHYLAEDDRNFHEHLMRIKVIGSKGGEWTYPFPGSYHMRTYDEMVDAFADLHGYDVMAETAFRNAMERPQKIVDTIDSFDIKEGIKIPTSLYESVPHTLRVHRYTAT